MVEAQAKQRSMKHFIPSDSTLWSEPASSSKFEFFVYKQNLCVWEAENWGRKQLHLCFDTAVCSEPLISLLSRLVL